MQYLINNKFINKNLLIFNINKVIKPKNKLIFY